MNVVKLGFAVCALFPLIVFNSLQAQSLTGLWLIEKVQMGNQEMTPVARWTRFNEDHTQESGNGWTQHSEGTWTYDDIKNELAINTTNGIIDEYGGFEILDREKDKMIWSRMEDGEKLLVYLKRINKLPKAPANKLLGVWQLDGTTEENVGDEISYIFLRWDNIIVEKKGENKRVYGMYKTHGHKQELQIIYYEDPIKQVHWNFGFNQHDQLILQGETDGKIIERGYIRIHEFPVNW